MFQQPVMPDIKQQERLSTSSDTCYNIILEYCFWYWYHILHRKDNSFIPKASTINEKTAFIK